jgi:autotransporter-associated beta strand protein
MWLFSAHPLNIGIANVGDDRHIARLLSGSTALAGGAVAALLVFAPFKVHAQTWDGGGANADWSTALNWNLNAEPAAAGVVIINGDGGSNANSTINTTTAALTSVAISASTVTVDATLISPLVTVSGTGNLTISAGAEIVGDVTFGSAGSGLNNGLINGQLSVTGGTFNNAGTVTGATSVNGGVLNLNAGTNLASGQNLMVSGGTVNVNVNDVIGAVVLTGGQINGAGTLSAISGFDVRAGTASAILGGGALMQKTTAGTVTLSGANTYTGVTTITAGVLNIQNATALGTTAGGTTVAANAALELQGGVNIGAEALTLNGTGVASGGALRNISGSNTFGGAITLNSASRINSNANTLNLSGGITGTNQNLTFGGAGNVFVSNTSNITTGTGTLTKDGSGTLLLGGTNSFTGDVLVSGGTLELLFGSALADTVLVTVDAGAQLRVFNSETVGNIAGSGSIQLGAGGVATLLTVGDGSDRTLSGAISDNVNVGSLTKQGTGSLTLSGANTYTGTTTITAGTLQVGAGGTVGTLGTGDVTNNATLAFNRLDALTVANAISGTGAVNQIGAGNMTLSGVLSHTGLTTINAGTLTLTNAGNTNSGGIIINGLTTRLVIGATGAAGPGTITTNGSVISYANGVTNAAPININSNTTQLEVLVGSATQSGVISETAGPRPLEKIGAGTLILNALNSYTGITTITAGALSAGSDLAFGAGTVTLAGGTLTTNAARNFANTLTTTAASIIDNASFALNLNGALTGTASLNFTGFGTTTLGANGTLTGVGTTVSLAANSILTLAPGVILTAPVITTAANSTLNIGAGGALRGTGSTMNLSGMTNVAAGGSIADASSINALNGSIINFAGNGQLIAPTLTRAGTGQININGAGGTVVQIGGSMTGVTPGVPPGDIMITNGGALAFTGGTVTGAAGAQIANGPQSIAPDIRLITAGAPVIDNRGNVLTLNGVLYGTQSVVFDSSVVNSGTTVITAAGSNTAAKNFAGAAATVNANTILRIDTGATFGNVTTPGALMLTVAAGGELQGGGTIAGSVAVNGTLRPGNNPAPGDIGNLSVQGNLTLNAGSNTIFQLNTPQVIGGPTNDLITVGGSLTVNAGAGLTVGPAVSGYYRLFNVTLGITGVPANFVVTPPGGSTANVEMIASGPNQVNLLLRNGNQSVQFFDAADNTGAGAGPQGGAGAWNATDTNWTQSAGVINDFWRSGVSVFGGAGGAVTVTGTQNVEGLQFTVPGHTLTGGTINLGGNPFGVGSINSFINVDAGVTTTIGSTITGGALDKLGTGTLVLTGANGHTGVTDVTAGVLNIQNATALGTTAGGTIVRSGAALEIQGGIAVVGKALTLNGTGVADGGALRNVAGASTWTGAVSLGSASRIVVAGGSLTISGAIGGANALIKDGMGNLILTGTNTYTGATTVNAGKLIVNGTIANSSSVTIANGAAMGGNAAIPNLTVQSGASISPGNSIGVVNIAGNLTLDAGSTTIIEIQQNQSDRINAGGTAAIAGTLQLVALGGPYVFASPYTIITATGGRTGTFATVNTDAAFGVGVTSTVTYNPNNVLVTLNAAPLAVPTTLALTRPQNLLSVAAGIDRAVAAGGDASPFFAIYNQPTREALTRAVNTLSGEVHTSANAMGLQASDQFLRVMFDPTNTGRNSAFGLGATGGSGINVWGAAFGQTGRNAGEVSNIGSSSRTASDWNLAFGADIRVSPDTILGIAAAGGQATASLAGGLGSAKADIFQFGAYSQSRFGALSINLASSFAALDIETNRAIPALGATSIKGSYRAHAWSGRAEATYATFTLSGITLSPYAAIQGTSTRTPSFVEKVNGGVAPFSVVATGTGNGTVRTEAGLRFDLNTMGPSSQMNVYARTAWAHYLSNDSSFSGAFAGLPGSGFKVTGARTASNSALLGLGADMKLGQSMTLGGTFNTEISPRQQSYSSSVKLNVDF